MATKTLQQRFPLKDRESNHQDLKDGDCRETCQTKFKPRCHTQVGQDVVKVQSSIRKCCSNSSPGSVREHKKKGGIETVPTQQSKESPEANTKPKNGSCILLFLGKGDEAPQQGDFSKGLHHDGETLQNRHLDGVVSSAQPKISLLGLHKSLKVKLIWTHDHGQFLTPEYDRLQSPRLAKSCCGPGTYRIFVGWGLFLLCFRHTNCCRKTATKTR